MLKKSKLLLLWIVPLAAFITVLLLLTSCKGSIKADVDTESAKDTSGKPFSVKVETGNKPEEDATAETTQKLAAFLKEEFKDDLKVMTENDRKFRFYETDLNGDAANEYLITFSNSYFCGTGGCTMILLDNNLKPITTFSVTNTPVYRSAEKSNGWNNLIVPGKGKSYVHLKFDGKKYPSNPSVIAGSQTPPSKKDVQLVSEIENGTQYSF